MGLTGLSCNMSYLVNFLGGKKRYPDGHFFIQTSTTTVENTATEAVLTGTGIGSVTLPANMFIPGRTIEVIARGFYNSTSGNLVIRVRYGGVSGTILLDSGAHNVGNNTGVGWVARGLITCRTAGSSGTVFSQGEFHELETNAVRGMVNTTATTINTTTQNDLVVTADWSVADPNNSFSATNIIFRVIA